MAEDDGRGFKIASAYVEVSLDEDQLDADIAGLNAKLAAIRDARVGIDQGTLDASIADAQAKLDALQARAEAGIDDEEFDAEFAAIKAQIDALDADKATIRVGTEGVPEATGELTGLAAVMRAIEDNSDGLVAAISGLSAAEAANSSQSSNTASNLGQVGNALKNAGEQAHQAHGWWGMLTKDVTLFGGALGDIHMVGTIPLWHILMDGVLETAIAFTEATVALVAFGFVAAPSVKSIYDHVKSVDDVVKTLGIDIPPVTGHLHDLGRALAPQMLEIFGGALNALSGNGDALARVMTKITTGFDDWMAKLDLFSDKQSHADGLIADGGEVLEQMSHILDNLGVAFENLMKADPGTVHFLGDLLEGASKLIEIFTEIPTPILFATLAIHSFLLWGGLLTSGIVKILSPVGGLVTMLGKLPGVSDEAAAGFAKAGIAVKTMGGAFPAATKATKELGTETEKTAESTSKMPPILTALNSGGIWGWAVIGAAAIGGLAYWMTTADSATKAFIANLDNGLAQLDAGQAILQIGTDFQVLDQQITTVGPHIQSLNEQTSALQTDTAKNLGAYLAALPKSLDSVSDLGNTVAKAGAAIDTGVKSMVSWFGLLHASMDKTSDIDAYKSAIVNLSREQDNLFHETGSLMKQGYTYSQTLGLMGLAGVQASDSFGLMRQKVANLIRGYQAMSVSGGILANSVNAVSFATEQQDSKVSDLTQGWTAFIGLVTGGMDAFSTFETQVAGLGETASGLATTIKVEAGRAELSSEQASSSASSSYTSVAMSASDANSAVSSYTSTLLDGKKAAQDAVADQQKLTTSLVDSGDTASQAAAAVGAYTKSVTQNGVGSDAQSAARARLLADLQSTKAAAQQASVAVTSAGASLDGVNAASLQLQQTWVGAITDGNSLMNALLMQASAAGLGAKGTALLTQAGKDMVAQLLPMAQGSSDATAQLYALAQQAGYQGPDSFQALVTWVGKTSNAEANLQDITARLTVASADLSTDVENLADALNQDLNQAMSAAIFQASGGQKAFDQFATAVLHSHGNMNLLKTSATQLATELLDTIGNTTQAHQEFDAFAIQLGLTKQQADQLWASVVRVAEAESRIPAHVSSTITITEALIAAGAVVGGGGTPSTGGQRIQQHAAGGQIRTGSARPGADDNLGLLSRDEWVIQAPAVHKYGSRLFADLNAMRYAAGGQVGGGPSASGGAAVTGGGFVANFNYYGTQHPTPEQRQAVVMDLTRAVGVAG